MACVTAQRRHDKHTHSQHTHGEHHLPTHPHHHHAQQDSEETVQLGNRNWKMRFGIMPDDGETQTTGAKHAKRATIPMTSIRHAARFQQTASHTHPSLFRATALSDWVIPSRGRRAPFGSSHRQGVADLGGQPSTVSRTSRCQTADGGGSSLHASRANGITPSSVG